MKRMLFVPFVVSLFFATSASAQVTIGTSASSTNPQRSGDATTGLFSPASGTVSVSSSGTEMVRVNSTGLGIATTSPAEALDSHVSIASGSFLSDNRVYALGLKNTDTSSGNAVAITFGIGSAGWTDFIAAVKTSADNANDTVGDLVFGGSPTAGNNFVERMRIQGSTGNVGIGTTSPANLLDIGTSGGVHITSGTPSSTSNALYNESGSLAFNGALHIFSDGQLQCGGANCANTTGSSTLNFCPYKGNVKTTASQGDYVIPFACLSATLTSMYVGGVASSSVAASTLYYIYLWNTSGTWVLDAETTGHATDSSTGIEIKSGDSTKTLVGMIHTDANKHIMKGGQLSTAGDTNTVATWDNRVPTYTQCKFTVGRTLTATTFTEINSENRCNFMSWGDAAVMTSSQNASSSTAGTSGNIVTEASLDSVSSNVFGFVTVTPPAANYDVIALPAGMNYPASEGFHFTILDGAVGSAGPTTTYLGNHETQVYTVQ